MTKALVPRVENVLPTTISPNQTGYVKGRYISERIRIKKKITPGLTVFRDFQRLSILLNGATFKIRKRIGFVNSLTIKQCDKTKVKTITVKNYTNYKKILKATTFRRSLNVIFKSK